MPFPADPQGLFGRGPWLSTLPFCCEVAASLVFVPLHLTYPALSPLTRVALGLTSH